MSLSSAERPGEKDEAACGRVAPCGPWLHDFNHIVCLAECRRINLICLAACNTSQKPLSRRRAGHRVSDRRDLQAHVDVPPPPLLLRTQLQFTQQ